MKWNHHDNQNPAAFRITLFTFHDNSIMFPSWTDESIYEKQRSQHIGSICF